MLINLIFQPYVQNNSTYIRDGQNLIQKSADIKLNRDDDMFVGDFESM